MSSRLRRCGYVMAALWFYSFVAGGVAQARSDIPSGNGSSWVVVGDFNRDGFLDLAVANAGTTGPGSITILLGNGDGTFRPGVAYDVGGSFKSVATADFNGDGILDIATGNRTTSFIDVLLGNGDGTFRPPSSFAGGNNPVFVAVGDFYGNGRPSLAMANEGGISDNGTISARRNVGGSFEFSRNFVAGNFPRAIAVGDFNGDGRDDMAVANFGGPENDTPSSISIVLSKPMSFDFFDFARNFAADIPTSIVSGDFNGDGVIDLAVVNTGGIRDVFVVTILLGNGDGTFQRSQDLDGGAFRFVLATGDFNGDGNLDLAMPGRVFLGNGDGTFQGPLDFNGPLGSEPGIAVGDFNGDGILDLVLATGRDTVSLYLGNGDGTFH